MKPPQQYSLIIVFLFSLNPFIFKVLHILHKLVNYIERDVFDKVDNELII